MGSILWVPIVPAGVVIPVNSIPPWGFILVNPSIGYLLLVSLLSLGLIIRGIHAIVSGVRGTE